MRVGELAALEDDATAQISETFWLRIPVGNLPNDGFEMIRDRLLEEKGIEATDGEGREPSSCQSEPGPYAPLARAAGDR